MKAKKEREYIEKYWKEMGRRLDAFQHSHDQADLHQFRVNVKKLKSAILLLQGSGKKSLIKRFRPVKGVFRKAGEVRDVYIHLQLSKRYHLENPQTDGEQQKSLKKLTHDFCAHTNKHRKKLKKARKKIDKAVRPLDAQTVLQFYKNNLHEIAAFLSHPVFNEQLHDSHKKMKYLLHNYKLAGQTGKPELPPLHLAYLDKLQELIGEWHDNVLSIDLFNSPAFNNPAVADRIKEQNGALQSKILEQVKGFEEKAEKSGKEVDRKITEE
ncbi:MAG: CHAD domain-containing protein [Williamsia sp.]|nr:CHAD domain-containing protein [Williamsia sp.]